MGTLGLGSSEVGLATTCMTRSPQTSIRMVPAAVLKVTPFGSLWDSLIANCGSFAAHAAELAMIKSRTRYLLLTRASILSLPVQKFRQLLSNPRIGYSKFLLRLGIFTLLHRDVCPGQLFPLHSIGHGEGLFR